MATNEETLTRKEKDYLRLVKSKCHIALTNVNSSMKRYLSHTTKEGVPVFNLEHTYNKIRLAARVIASVPNLEDVIVVSSKNLGQRAVIKFAHFTGCQATSDSRWTPGMLTNHQTKKFKEPRMMVVVEPYSDRKAIVEASYMNIPIIALCNTDNNLQYVDIAIPCNNRSTESISMIFWLLAREVRILKRLQDKGTEWDVKVDLFYYKDAEKQEELMRNDEEGENNDDEDNDKWDEGGDDEEENENDDEWGDDDNDEN